jgi:hypothetical protein
MLVLAAKRIRNYYVQLAVWKGVSATRCWWHDYVYIHRFSTVQLKDTINNSLNNNRAPRVLDCCCGEIESKVVAQGDFPSYLISDQICRGFIKIRKLIVGSGHLENFTILVSSLTAELVRVLPSGINSQASQPHGSITTYDTSNDSPPDGYADPPFLSSSRYMCSCDVAVGNTCILSPFSSRPYNMSWVHCRLRSFRAIH